MKIAPIAAVKAQLSAFVKAAQESPIVVTKNGKPVAMLIGIAAEDDLERLVLTYSKKLHAVLNAAEQRIRETGGMPHEELWRQVDTAYAKALNNDQASPRDADTPRSRRTRKGGKHPITT